MPAKSKRRDTAELTAQVFLWSPQGRSFRECASGPLPADLTALRPSAEARRTARTAFERLGFAVDEDELGAALTLRAARGVFTRVFGAGAIPGRVEEFLSASPLPVPAELAAMTDAIVLLPPVTLY